MHFRNSISKALFDIVCCMISRVLAVCSNLFLYCFIFSIGSKSDRNVTQDEPVPKVSVLKHVKAWDNCFNMVPLASEHLHGQNYLSVNGQPAMLITDSDILFPLVNKTLKK